MFRQIESKYKHDEQEIEQSRKMQLQSMKELYKPIESAEIMAHSRKMDLIVQSKVSKLREDRRERIQN